MLIALNKPFGVLSQFTSADKKRTLADFDVEGGNRQVRRITAALGFPTLRLIRVAIGNAELFQLALLPGTWANISPSDLGLAARPHPIGRNSTGKRPGDSLSTGLRQRRYWG